MNVDFIKIRVDDNLGATRKMRPNVYQAIIEAAHARDLMLTAHLYYLEDAKGLLEAGADFLAHSVRDTEVDDELIAMLTESGVCYCPTLMREVSTYVYESRPDWVRRPVLHQRGRSRRGDAARGAGVPRAHPEQRQRADLQGAARGGEGEPQDALRRRGAHRDGHRHRPAGRFQGYFEHGSST